MVAAKLANLEQGARRDLSPIGEKLSQSEAASMLNVGKRSVERAREVTDHGAPELVAALVDRPAALRVSALLFPAVGRVAFGLAPPLLVSNSRDSSPKSSAGMLATRSAVLRWRSERPASEAACARVGAVPC